MAVERAWSPDRTRRGPTVPPDEERRPLYFDTPDFRLRSRGMRVRVTLDDATGIATWTLDSAADREGRSWAGDAEVFPPAMLGMLRGIVRGEALRPVAESPPDPPVESGARPAVAATALGGLIRVRIADALGRLLEHDLRIRLDPLHPGSEEVGHAHAATTRLRAELKTCRSALDPDWLRRTRRDLRWFGRLLDAFRAADVLARGLDAAPSAGAGLLKPGRSGRLVDADGLAQLRSSLAGRRWHAGRDLAAAIDSDRYLDLLDRLDAAARRPLWPGDGDPATWRRGRTGRSARSVDGTVGPAARRELRRVVRRAWRALRRAVGTAGPEPGDGALERIGLRAEELRYAAEMAAPVIGKPARRMAARAAALERALGAHHDAVAAEDWLRQEAGARPGAGFVAGALAAGWRRRQRRQRRAWIAAWRRLDRRSLRRWLR